MPVKIGINDTTNTKALRKYKFNKIIKVIIILLILCFCIHTVSALSISVSPTKIKTGTSVLTITISSNREICDTSLTLYGLVNKNFELGDISGVTKVSFPVTVHSQGIYNLDVWFSGTVNNTPVRSINHFAIEVVDKPVFYVTFIRGNISLGNYSKVKIFVVNKGGDAKNVLLTLNGFKVKKAVRFFKLWREGETKVLDYSVYASENDSAGEKQGVLTFEYLDEFGDNFNESVPISLNFYGTPELLLSNFETVPAKLYPDTNFTLRLSVENAGTYKAKNVRVNLVLPEGLKGETQAYLGDISKGEVKTAFFELKCSKYVEGKIKIGINILSKKSYNFTAYLYVFPVERAVNISGVYTIPERVKAGKPFTLNIAVENSGKQEVRGVRIVLDLPEGFKGRNMYFVGSLSSGDSATSTFDLVAGNAGKHVFRAKIYYMDSAFRKHVEFENFTIYVFPSENYIPYIVLVLFLIAILVWIKKRKGKGRGKG